MSSHPQPNYHFRVQWGGTRSGFAEVSGLDIEVAVIEYREGEAKEGTPKKLPGLVTYKDVTLKRGIVEGDGEFYAWILSAVINKVERRDVVISLLNAEHNPIMSWKLKNAFPTRLEGPRLDGADSAVAIETLVLAHEGLSVETA